MGIYEELSSGEEGACDVRDKGHTMYSLFAKRYVCVLFAELFVSVDCIGSL